ITLPQFLGLIIGLFAGFFTHMLGNTEGDGRVASGKRRQALSFTPEGGRAVLYVYRDGFYGKLQGVDITLVGQRGAQLKSPRFTRLVLAPGRHTLSAQASSLRGSEKRDRRARTRHCTRAIAIAKLAVKMRMNHMQVDIDPISDLTRAQRVIRGMKMVGASL